MRRSAAKEETGRSRAKNRRTKTDTAKTVPDKEYRGRSSSPAKGFGGAVGVTGPGEDGGAGNGQGGDMSQRIQVGGAGGVKTQRRSCPDALKREL